MPVAAQQERHSSPEAEVVAIVEGFHAALNHANSAAAQELFHPAARMSSTTPGMRGEGIAFGPISEVVNQSVVPPAGFYEMRLSKPTVLVSGSLAVVWSDFSYYQGGELRLCGTEAAQLIRSNSGWKITSLGHWAHQDCVTGEVALGR
jgi:hypothetical protein